MNDSPAKKLDFSVQNKENNSEVAVRVAGIPEIDFPEESDKKDVSVAPGIKETEVTEILLQENPHRFVLFPIQHHEVSDLEVTRLYAFPNTQHTNTDQIDMAHVQEGHGILLDC